MNPPSEFTSRKLCYDVGDHVWAGNDGHNSPCPSGQFLVSSQAAETDIYCNKLQSSPILLHRWKILNDEEIYLRYCSVNRLAHRSIFPAMVHTNAVLQVTDPHLMVAGHLQTSLDPDVHSATVVVQQAQAKLQPLKIETAS